MNKERTLKRRNQRKLKYIERKRNFNIRKLKKEIFQIQNGNNIDNIFREKLEDREVFSYER